MEGEADPFDYFLAEKLGMTVGHMHESMSNAEYVGWRAFATWRAAMAEFARQGRE